MSDTISNRYEFTMLLEASGCNPNGDPDMGNLPRQDEETGIGYITDVAIKRRIRNYIEDAFSDKVGCDILMKKGTSLNRKIAEAVLKVNGEKDIPKDFTNQKVAETAAEMEKMYWDVRTFGGVLSTGLNAGQVRGAVQIGIAKSVDPIHVEDISITRMSYAEDPKKLKSMDDYLQEEQSRPDDKKRTMGNKQFIQYGLYIVKGTVSACLAEKNGFTEDDLNMLFEALIQMYNHDISASKEGMSVVSPLIIFKHVGTQTETNPEENARAAKLGCAPAYKLFRLLNVRKKADVEYPRSYDDYDVALNLSKLPGGVIAGIKEDAFSPVIWGTEAILSSEHDGIRIE
jgi:CRISPR-associated protein Csd2